MQEENAVDLVVFYAPPIIGPNPPSKGSGIVPSGARARQKPSVLFQAFERCGRFLFYLLPLEVSLGVHVNAPLTTKSAQNGARGDAGRTPNGAGRIPNPARRSAADPDGALSWEIQGKTDLSALFCAAREKKAVILTRGGGLVGASVSGTR